MKLTASFFIRSDVLEISHNLIGKSLYTRFNGKLTGGTIVETEAYAGAADKACHAYNNRKTTRTATMFREGGIAYVYLCYGIHHLFNIITNQEGIPDAVLIRAIEPHTGKDTMLRRRGMESYSPNITSGPGKLTQALGIRTQHDSMPLNGNEIWLEAGPNVPLNIETSPRIGIAYAEEFKDKPWRFYIEGNPYVSG